MHFRKKRQREKATEWFNNNRMIINPDKLPVIFLTKTANSVSHKLNKYDDNTETTKSVKLLAVEVGAQLRFN